MAYDSITEGPILGALLGALSLQPVMTTMLHLMNMVRKKKKLIYFVFDVIEHWMFSVYPQLWLAQSFGILIHDPKIIGVMIMFQESTICI